LLRVLHSESVASECVTGIFRQYLVECGDAIHESAGKS
jgi:hypothetical protein